MNKLDLETLHIAVHEVSMWGNVALMCMLKPTDLKSIIGLVLFFNSLKTVRRHMRGVPTFFDANAKQSSLLYLVSMAVSMMMVYASFFSETSFIHSYSWQVVMPFKIFTMREFVNLVPWSMCSLGWSSLKEMMEQYYDAFINKSGMSSHAARNSKEDVAQSCNNEYRNEFKPLNKSVNKDGMNKESTIHYDADCSGSEASVGDSVISAEGMTD